MDNAAASPDGRPRLVELCGLTGTIVARRPDGRDEEVNAAPHNGKKGIIVEEGSDAVRWKVRTFDDQHLLVPSHCVLELDFGDEAGCDAILFEEEQHWTPGLALVLAALSTKGYCLARTFQAEPEAHDACRCAMDGLRFSELPTAFEEALFGHSARHDEVAWFRDARAFQEAAPRPLRYVSRLCRLLTPLAEVLSFRAWDIVDPAVALLLRRAHRVGADATKGSSGQNATGAPGSHTLREGTGGTATRLEDGERKALADFLRRRRICFMHAVTCGAAGRTVSLTPRHPAVSAEGTKQELRLGPGTLLAFREDLFSCSCEPADDEDLLVQAWLLEQPQETLAEFVRGEAASIMAAMAMRGVSPPGVDKASIIALRSQVAAGGPDYSALVQMYTVCTDNGQELPFVRWDHSLYYSPEGSDVGLANVKHSSMMSTQDTQFFAHDAFGFSEEDAKMMSPSFFMSFESISQVLHEAGLPWCGSKEGLPLMMALCGASRETDTVDRIINWVPSRWGGNHMETQLIGLTLGFRGKVMQVDTACSASLVAVNEVNQELRRNAEGLQHRIRVPSPIRMGVACGVGYIDSPWVYIGLTAAHMLGYKGRSLTFDNSACGFARGEGVSSVLLDLSGDMAVTFQRYACMEGGCTNQDGRSASLTAPNGPSQAAAVRSALRDAGRTPVDMLVTEMHGTGTALGDPVETGSMRSVVFGRQTDVPFFHQAGKSLTSHLELGAGTTGIIRIMAAARQGCIFPNCHLRELNHNIDDSSFPAMWQNEAADTGHESIHVGVSSFGFGGTNSRAQLWAGCRRGPHRRPPVVAVNGGQELVVRLSDEGPSSAVRLRLDELRVSPALHQAACQDAGDPLRRVSISGTWNAWSRKDEMTATVDGAHEYFLTVSGPCRERFHLVLDSDPNLAIYPAAHGADCNEHIEGPDSDNHDHHRCWEINTTGTNCPNGTTLRIQFLWDYNGKSMSWAQCPPRSRKDHSFAHQPGVGMAGGSAYSVVSTWTGWQLQGLEMKSPGSWETCFRLGLSGEEEFRLVSTQSPATAFYPAGERVELPDVPLMGPDTAHAGRGWLVCGRPGELVKVRLYIKDEDIAVTLESKTLGARAWHHSEGIRR